MSGLSDKRRRFFTEFSVEMSPDEFLTKWETLAPNIKNKQLKNCLREMVCMSNEQRIVAGFMLRRQAAQLVEDADRRDLCFLAAMMEPDYDDPIWQENPTKVLRGNEFAALLTAARQAHAMAIAKYSNHSLDVIKQHRHQLSELRRN